ncbi:MAG: aminotransferase class I/II-fold pyridoxal phosphate-dependent enzyme [Phycisphaeraceae bacterium]|nr:aminotransferase class I/II-fold pyridoxal phosphate-dependent enzyme [Phycisphaeraceae bacterium]MBX3407383.1 aminotransferase class I/II-fold pyridoxal phosphate-dependent enzyme [Phycisphaeraceae bacterium]
MDSLIADRAKRIDASGIRRVFDLGARLKDPINLSIGQPDFPVPEPIKRAAIDAIENNHNGYTQTQGIATLREKIVEHLRTDVNWDVDPRPLSSADASKPGVMVTSGTSGALMLAFQALLDPGDEAIIPDPYFVMYPHICTMVGARPVLCDTYPDFRMTAARVEPLLTPRTKLVLLNSPSNPAGVVASNKDCRELLELCRAKNVLLISDEIYDTFTYADACEPSPFGGGSGAARCPSPARFPGAEGDVFLIRGFGKTYGVTGWRLGYAAGPRRLIEEISKLQQYTFVCAPSALQHGAVACFDVDMSAQIADYQKRRDMVVSRLSKVTDVTVPGGAFYAFVKVPERLGLTASRFIDKCLENSLLVIPGNVFSKRDTHFRLSYATDARSLERGLAVLEKLMR